MIIWRNKEIPCLYLLLFKLMKEKSKNHLFISYRQAKEILRRRIINIPRMYHYFILEEMTELGMIRKIGNKSSINYEFTNEQIDKLLLKYSSIF